MASSLDKGTIDRLIDESFKAKENAYAPYSNFPVGAALLCEDGTIVTGVNVEIAAICLGSCAEKTAIGCAVTKGHRKFKAVCVSSDMADTYIAPCGSCRQVLAEFGLEFPVLMTKPDRSYIVKTVRELLPESFTKDSFTNFQDLRKKL